jgi:tetratricopeptide (TPR) repeat protein
MHKLISTPFFFIVLPFIFLILILIANQQANDTDSVESYEWFKVGRSLSQSGHFEEALTVLDKAIQLNPRNVEALNGRGITHYYKKQYDMAIDDYTRAIKLDPGLAKLYYNRGTTYTYKHQYDKAIEDFTAAIRLDSSFTLAYLNRGNAYLIQQQYEKAFDDYSKVLELKPTMAEANNKKEQFDSVSKKPYISL